MELNLTDLLADAIEHKASDVFISVNAPPLMKVEGKMKPLDPGILDNEQTHQLVYSILTDREIARFEETHELNKSLRLGDFGRFRVNVFRQRGEPALVARNIKGVIPSIDQLGLPETLRDLVMLERGLILVVGGTGTGKSTTLAAMIDYRNASDAGHILTIEDPIEFVHTSRRCLINQREVHRDTHGFNQALRSALREDPDIILVGEMRDIETIRLALTAAETGHLVFATLHTSSAAKTIDRIIDVVPAGEKAMVRSMLSESLRAVIAQTLMKRLTGGRIAAHEVMIATPAIRNLIREDKVAQMYSAIQTGQNVGMHTLDQYLETLVNRGIISKQEAARKAVDRKLFM